MRLRMSMCSESGSIEPPRKRRVGLPWALAALIAIIILTTADGLAHDDVTAIARATDGNDGLWVGTARGLQRWTPGGRFTRVGEADGVSGVIPAMAVSVEGLWASEQGRAMFLYRD